MEKVRVRVTVAGYLRQATDVPARDFSVEKGAPLAGLLHAMARCFGEGFSSRFLDRSGRLDPGIMVFVDGTCVPYQGLDAVRLRRSCTVAFVPVAAGG